MKRLNGHQTERQAKARRESALSRGELRLPTTPRDPAAGPTSMAMKRQDPGDALLIDAYLRSRSRGDK